MIGRFENQDNLLPFYRGHIMFEASLHLPLFTELVFQLRDILFRGIRGSISSASIMSPSRADRKRQLMEASVEARTRALVQDIIGIKIQEIVESEDYVSSGGFFPGSSQRQGQRQGR